MMVGMMIEVTDGGGCVVLSYEFLCWYILFSCSVIVDDEW